MPDVCAIAALYPEWLERGQGAVNFLAVPDLPTDVRNTAFDLPGGVIRDADIGTIRRIDDWKDTVIRNAVSEDVAHAWYEGDVPLHPWDGKTEPQPGPFDDEGKYSWVKAPRYEGAPTEVGPLAAVLAGYAQGAHIDQKVGGCGAHQHQLTVQKELWPPRFCGQRSAGTQRGRFERACSSTLPISTGSRCLITSPAATDACTTRRRFRRAKSAVLAFTKHRGERCRTGWSSRTERSPTTRPSSPRHGTRARATIAGQSGPYEASIRGPPGHRRGTPPRNYPSGPRLRSMYGVRLPYTHA